MYAALWWKLIFSIHEIVKKEKEIQASFAVTPQAVTPQSYSQVSGKYLVKMKQAWNL